MYNHKNLQVDLVLKNKVLTLYITDKFTEKGKVYHHAKDYLNKCRSE